MSPLKLLKFYLAIWRERTEIDTLRATFKFGFRRLFVQIFLNGLGNGVLSSVYMKSWELHVCYKKNSYISDKTVILGTQKNHLDERSFEQPKHMRKLSQLIYSYGI